MIRSMTSYGGSKLNNELMDLKIDIKSVNGRYLDIRIRASNSLAFLEERIKNEVKKYFSRGNIDIFIDLRIRDWEDENFTLDKRLAENYLNKLRDLSNFLGTKSNIEVIDLIRLDSDIVIKSENDLKDNSHYSENILETLRLALENSLEMRTNEGYNIQKDLENKLARIYDHLGKIRMASSDIVKINTQNLLERIKVFLNDKGVELNKDRLYNEIVFYGDRFAIDEEITRLDSHLKLFTQELDKEKASGKKLDFILQEMLRETNTIGNKSNLEDIINNVIEVKSLIEMIREQVQNVE